MKKYTYIRIWDFRSKDDAKVYPKGLYIWWQLFSGNPVQTNDPGLAVYIRTATANKTHRKQTKRVSHWNRTDAQICTVNIEEKKGSPLNVITFGGMSLSWYYVQKRNEARTDCMWAVRVSFAITWHVNTCIKFSNAVWSELLYFRNHLRVSDKHEVIGITSKDLTKYSSMNIIRVNSFCGYIFMYI